MRLLVGGAQLTAGVALFFVGLSMMRGGIQGMAGTALRRALISVTRSSYRAGLFGLLLTLGLQSTSLLVVTLMELVDAEVIPLSAALAVVVGGNVGASLTVQFLAFRLYDAAPIVIAAGVMLLVLARSSAAKSTSLAILGFGTLYGAIAVVSSAAEAVSRLPLGSAFLLAVSPSALASGLFGAALTAVVQSNGVANGILLSLSRRGLISLRSAVAVVMGANVGSGSLAFIAAMPSGPSARTLAVANGLVNTAGVVLLLPLFGPFVQAIGAVSPSLPQAMATAHMTFNFLASAALFPFLVPLGALSQAGAALLYGPPIRTAPLHDARRL